MGQVPAHGGWTAEQTDVAEEQIRAIECHTVRHADIADRTARPRAPDRLHHRLLSADALEHRIGADAVRELLNPFNALVAALRDDVGRTELARELLAGLVAAHR